MRPRLRPFATTATIALVLGLAGTARAQQSDGQIWTTTTANVALSGDATLSLHLIARGGDAADGISHLQWAADMDMVAGRGVRLGAGYSYVRSYDRGRVTAREHRIRQQMSVGLGRLAGGDLDARLRFEQRWRDDGGDPTLRLRARLLWNRPVGPGGLALRFAHETFYDPGAGDRGGNARYDRMRNSVALRRRLGPAVTAEGGYLNEYIVAGARPDRINHALTLALSFDL